MSRLKGGIDEGGGLLALPAAPQIVGGEAQVAVVTGGVFSSDAPVSVRGSVLQVDGVLYATAPDNAWAVDARTGTVLWHYYWKTKGGTHTANKGMGMYKNRLFFETADDYLVSLDARTGQETTWSPLTPPTASLCGIHAFTAFPTRRKPTCWTAIST